jgi:hypothetical protein
VTEKETRQKSAEALARAALANVDANRPAPPDALIGPGLTDTRSASADIQPQRLETSRPDEARPQTGLGHAWILVAVVVMFASALVGWGLFLEAF